MTGSGRSTSGIAAFRRRSINGDLFVLTVLRYRSRSLLLGAKGATSLRTEPDNNSPMRRPLLLPRKPPMPLLGIVVLEGLLAFLCVSDPLSSWFEQRNKRHRH
jgi:hypothetical protein